MYEFSPKLGENAKTLLVFPPSIPLYAVYYNENERTFYTKEVLFMVVREITKTAEKVRSEIKVNVVSFNCDVNEMKEEGSEESTDGYIGLSLSKTLNQNFWKDRLEGSSNTIIPFSPMGLVPGGILIEQPMCPAIENDGAVESTPVTIPAKRGRGRPPKK
jgi:hypothetical protein